MHIKISYFFYSIICLVTIMTLLVPSVNAYELTEDQKTLMSQYKEYKVWTTGGVWIEDGKGEYLEGSGWYPMSELLWLVEEEGENLYALDDTLKFSQEQRYAQLRDYMTKINSKEVAIALGNTYRYLKTETRTDVENNNAKRQVCIYTRIYEVQIILFTKNGEWDTDTGWKDLDLNTFEIKRQYSGWRKSSQTFVSANGISYPLEIPLESIFAYTKFQKEKDGFARVCPGQ